MFLKCTSEIAFCLLIFLCPSLFLRAPMQSAVESVENASIISDVAHDGHRLWIGNIDAKITEWVNPLTPGSWSASSSPPQRQCRRVPVWLISHVSVSWRMNRRHWVCEREALRHGDLFCWGSAIISQSPGVFTLSTCSWCLWYWRGRRRKNGTCRGWFVRGSWKLFGLLWPASRQAFPSPLPSVFL